MEYTKKVIIFDERSSPEARAKRLRQLRNVAHMKREQLCKEGNIAMASLKRWELAYYGGLPVDGAKKIIECVSKRGIVCALEWLLHEVGNPPLIDPQFRKEFYAVKSDAAAVHKELSSPDEEEQHIISELLLFRKNHTHTIDLKVNDDGLSPKYKIHDYVAGIQIPLHHIPSLLHQDCILKIQNGQLLLRNLREGQQKDCYHLVCTNEQTTVKTPILYNVKIIMAAKILRHYRMSSPKG